MYTNATKTSTQHVKKMQYYLYGVIHTLSSMWRSLQRLSRHLPCCQAEHIVSHPSADGSWRNTQLSPFITDKISNLLNNLYNIDEMYITCKPHVMQYVLLDLNLITGWQALDTYVATSKETKARYYWLTWHQWFAKNRSLTHPGCVQKHFWESKPYHWVNFRFYYNSYQLALVKLQNPMSKLKHYILSVVTAKLGNRKFPIDSIQVAFLIKLVHNSCKMFSSHGITSFLNVIRSIDIYKLTLFSQHVKKIVNANFTHKYIKVS